MTMGNPFTGRGHVLEDAGPEVEDFANALDDCLFGPASPSELRDRILELPQKYYDNAVRRLARARPNGTRYGTQDDNEMDVDEADTSSGSPVQSEQIQQLEKEVQTWDLLRRLLPLRYARQNLAASTRIPRGNHDLLDDFLQTDPVAQERRAVIQWLQSNAASGPDIDELARELQQNADRGDIVAHGWLHTRSAIKLRKSVTAWPHLLDRQSPNIGDTHINSDGAPLVTQLDPDASSRQGRKLEPQDEYFERAIWLGCFEHLRRGASIDSIREWCRERTELWRAISMSALPLSTDNSSTVAKANATSLALWRRMCFSLARQGGCDDYERAVYGVLSGDIQSVEKIAHSWDDYLFANYNALLRTQLDNFILGQLPSGVAANLTQSFSSFDAVQFHGDPSSVERRLIRSLEANPRIHAEATEPNKALQASLISREISNHLYEQGVVLATDAKDTDKLIHTPEIPGLDIDKQKFVRADQPQGLRIAAHIYLLHAILDKYSSGGSVTGGLAATPDGRRTQENIVASYAAYLRIANLKELIPLYCSLLDTTRCYEVLSYNLISEQNESQRMMQLKLIKKAGIDVVKFVTVQTWLMHDDLGQQSHDVPAKAFSILQAGPATPRRGRPIKTDFFGDDEEAAIDPRHENLIRSLEWLQLVSETWPNVLASGARIYKYFLKNLHLSAARQLMKRVPYNDIFNNLNEVDVIEGQQEDELDFWGQQLERSGISDVQATTVLADARNFRDLEALVRALDSLETIASLAEISKEEPLAKRDFWNKVGDEIKNTKDNMRPLLSEWLAGAIEAGDDELGDLRQAYLPEVIMAYVSALQFAGTGLSRDNLLECMELAAVVAERNSNLAKSFVSAGRMRELVEAFAACSKALAISTGDKRATGTGNKKLREMGWSRDLWSVKP